MGNVDSLNPGIMKPGLGSLFVLGENCLGRKALSNTTLSNGLCWSSDMKSMYFIDTFAYTVDAFDYDVDTGAIGNKRSVFNVKEAGIPGGLDGMTIDTRGHLWIAVWDGGRVRDLGLGTSDLGLGTWDLGLGTWDLG
jgi:gluconolactonase